MALFKDHWKRHNSAKDPRGLIIEMTSYVARSFLRVSSPQTSSDAACPACETSDKVPVPASWKKFHFVDFI